MKIATWNICCLSNFANLYQNPKNSIKNIIKQMRIIKSDIFCLQEAFDKKIRQKLIKEFKNYNVAYEENKEPFKINSGLMVISKFPIIDYGFINFIESCGEDKFANKGFLYIVVKYKNSNTVIVNTHLNNPTPLFSFFSDSSDVLKNQLSQLFHTIYLKFNLYNNIIVCGDFNTNPYFIKNFLKTSLLKNKITIKGFSNQSTVIDEYDTIDHILILNKSAEHHTQNSVEYIYNSLCSDHFLIVKVLNL